MVNGAGLGEQIERKGGIVDDWQIFERVGWGSSTQTGNKGKGLLLAEKRRRKRERKEGRKGLGLDLGLDWNWGGNKSLICSGRKFLHGFDFVWGNWCQYFSNWGY